MEKDVNFRVAVKAFIINNNKLLIIKRAKSDPQMPEVWEIPGGRLNLGESPFEGLKREVKVQCSKPKERQSGQFFIQLPKEVVRELNIEKGDKVIIDIPLKDKSKYSIKLKKAIK